MNPNQRIQEFKRYLDNHNLSLATRRAMDLTVDIPELKSFQKSVTNIRAEYNLTKSLGEGELEGVDSDIIIDRLNSFYNRIQELDIPDHSVSRDTSEVVQVTSLEKHFKNGGHQFHLGPISLGLSSGKITGVVGENGNGKTTLLNILAGETAHDAGTIRYPGFELESFSHYKLKQQIAFIPQRLMPWSGTLKQNLKFSAAIHGIKGQDNEDRVDFIIHRLGLTRFQNLGWKQLSSGYKLRFELARMVVWHPRFLVLDEPIANLDLVAQQLFLQDLSHLAASTKHPLGIILSSQQLHQIEEVADQIIFLRDGKPLFVGDTSSFGDNRTHNSFEISGKFTADQLMRVTREMGEIRIEENGVTFTLHTSLEIHAKHILDALIQADLEPTYFRNISLSTRKLLSDAL